MYKKKVHIHFIGIGGIGMSGIATILHYQGYTISGCDTDVEQQSIKNLQQIGCTIIHGNNTHLCADSSIGIVVYTSAVKADNAEIIAAQQRGIATIPRALMLAELMRTKYSVAITGSHGKTTTTSLISHILIEASIDPTVIIGGHLQTISTNARFGLSDFLVAEADESDRSLLFLHPTLAVVTNIDLEHLETYCDLDDIKQTFKQFLSLLPFYGKAFVCGDDPHIASILPIAHVTTVKYGIGTDDRMNEEDTCLRNSLDIFARNIELWSDHSVFDVHTKHDYLGSVYLNMPGKHNVLNALGAIALSLDLDISFSMIQKALSNFQGVDQRFTYRGAFKGARLFDDYGHHPKEIELTLEVARRCSSAKICVIFQPHRYTRTYHLWDQFIEVFLKSSIDHLVVTDIFPASEQPIDGVTGQYLIQDMQSRQAAFSCEYIPYYDNAGFTIEEYVQQHAHSYDLILFLGAGKVNRVAHNLIKSV